jgi:hypothetical protein
MMYFSQKLEYPHFVQKRFSWKRVTVQDEKTRLTPQLQRALAEKAEVAPNAKSSCEVICYYGPP